MCFSPPRDDPNDITSLPPEIVTLKDQANAFQNHLQNNNIHEPQLGPCGASSRVPTSASNQSTPIPTLCATIIRLSSIAPHTTSE